MEQPRYVLVGAIGAGKSTLFNALNGEYQLATKTQAVEFDEKGCMDTPGEFFSHPRLYRALINTVSGADIIIYVHAADDMTCRLPAGLLDVYQDKTLITAITKVDLPNIDLPAVIEMLKNQGLKEPFWTVSNQDPNSIHALLDYLKQNVELIRKNEWANN